MFFMLPSVNTNLGKEDLNKPWMVDFIFSHAANKHRLMQEQPTLAQEHPDFLWQAILTLQDRVPVEQVHLGFRYQLGRAALHSKASVLVE
jgi:hypothetical protein